MNAKKYVYEVLCQNSTLGFFDKQPKLNDKDFHIRKHELCNISKLPQRIKKNKLNIAKRLKYINKNIAQIEKEREKFLNQIKKKQEKPSFIKK
jgi:hypothetical protein